jgi:membrane associated rhomboid family serine protease
MSLEIQPARASLLATIRSHATLLFGLLGLMWVIALLDLLPWVNLNRFGIQPRTIEGLWGILGAPFLHAGLAHLAANSVPFIVLGGIVLLGGRTLFWAVTMFVTIAGGLGVWIFAGSHSNHIGASGLIFGYLGFLLARGIVERSIGWILVSLAILAGYGGMLIGVLPLRIGISWQSHFFGFLAGLAAARLLVSPRQKVVAQAPLPAPGEPRLE